MFGSRLALPSAARSSSRRRQTDGAVSESLFYRRAYHWSAVLDNVVYIDGGQFSYSNDGTIAYDYSTTLLSIDFSKDWTNDTLTVGSIFKPPGAPDLVRGGLWADTTNKLLYNGFAGDVSSEFNDETAQSYGLWSFSPAGDIWTNLNDSAASAFQGEARPFSGAVASGGGMGYHLGGFVYDSLGNKTAISGLLTYDFNSNILTNKTVSGVASGGRVQKGRMIYIPNFGTDGVLISLGGMNDDNLYPMNSVEVYDPKNEVWYLQETTGGTPEPRIEFCVAGVASTNRTFDIFVYAGWDNVDTSSTYDEVFVLSLPSFHWFKANYDSIYPRHGLTCEHVGGGQVLSIGGIDTSKVGTTSAYNGPFSTIDPFDQGLSIFDLSTLGFASSYTANRSEYTLSTIIQDYYNTNDRYADFTMTGLQNVFAVENFSTTASSNTTSSNSTSAAAGSSGTNTGAIVGGVIGGVAFVAIVAGFAAFLFRRRKRGRAADAAAEEHPPKQPAHDYSRAVDVNQVYQELPPSRYDLPLATEAYSVPVHEAPATGARVLEMP